MPGADMSFDGPRSSGTALAGAAFVVTRMASSLSIPATPSFAVAGSPIVAWPGSSLLAGTVSFPVPLTATSFPVAEGPAATWPASTLLPVGIASLPSAGSTSVTWLGSTFVPLATTSFANEERPAAAWLGSALMLGEGGSFAVDGEGRRLRLGVGSGRDVRRFLGLAAVVCCRSRPTALARPGVEDGLARPSPSRVPARRPGHARDRPSPRPPATARPWPSMARRCRPCSGLRRRPWPRQPRRSSVSPVQPPWPASALPRAPTRRPTAACLRLRVARRRLRCRRAPILRGGSDIDDLRRVLRLGTRPPLPPRPPGPGRRRRSWPRHPAAAPRTVRGRTPRPGLGAAPPLWPRREMTARPSPSLVRRLRPGPWPPRPWRRWRTSPALRRARRAPSGRRTPWRRPWRRCRHRHPRGREGRSKPRHWEAATWRRSRPTRACGALQRRRRRPRARRRRHPGSPTAIRFRAARAVARKARCRSGWQPRWRPPFPRRCASRKACAGPGAALAVTGSFSAWLAAADFRALRTSPTSPLPSSRCSSNSAPSRDSRSAAASAARAAAERPSPSRSASVTGPRSLSRSIAPLPAPVAFGLLRRGEQADLRAVRTGAPLGGVLEEGSIGLRRSLPLPRPKPTGAVARHSCSCLLAEQRTAPASGALGAARPWCSGVSAAGAESEPFQHSTCRAGADPRFVHCP